MNDLNEQPAQSARSHTEQWRLIPDFLRYEVSDKGRVRKSGDFGIKKLTARPNGRLVTRVKDSKPRTLAVDKLVASAFLGPRPPAHFVAHKDDDLANNAVENLEYRPRGRNLDQIESPPWASLKGRMKLREADAREIKRRALAGEPGIALAREFGVTPAAVSQIKHGKKWRNLH